MKNLKVITVFLVVLLFSCQKDDINSNTKVESIQTSQLPQTSVAYINNNYTGATIKSANKQTTGSTVVYQANLNWNIDLFFDSSGSFKSANDDDNSNDTYISINNIPSNILNYIQSNYGNLTIHEAEINTHLDGSISYEIEFTNGMELYFAEDGSFIGIGQDISSADSNHIAASDLPAAIMNYINTQHPNDNIVKAEVKTDINGNVIKYEIDLASGISLNFDANGNYFADDSNDTFEDHIDISFSELPAAAQDFITDNYSGVDIDRIRKKLYIDGTIRQFEVELDNDVEITFAPDGSVISIDN